MNITYPQSSEVLIAIVRTERDRYEVRLVADKGLTYMYIVDGSGDSYGKHGGCRTLEEALEGIQRIENPFPYFAKVYER